MSMIYVSQRRPGYIFLVSVLAVGVIAAATSTSLLLLGWAAEQNGFQLSQSLQAFEHAQGCAEKALNELRTTISYGGNQTFNFEYGSCQILAVDGTGSEDRTICAEGRSGQTTRRIQIDIDRLFPTVVIRDWSEVTAFTKCQ